MADVVTQSVRGKIHEKKSGLIIKLLAFVVLSIALLAYIGLGAIIMKMIEGGFTPVIKGPTAQRNKAIKEIVSLHMENISKTKFERELKEIMLTFQRIVKDVARSGWEGGPNTTIPDEWTLGASFLYTASLVTTVGYGNVSPRTTLGRFFTIVYSMVGVPLALVCISVVGFILARFFCMVVYHCNKNSLDEETGRVIVPLWISVAILVGYLMVGAVFFTGLMQGEWSVFESFYFCFITLSTIGLGDYVYGGDVNDRSSSAISIVYLLVGVSLISMCFDLMREEVARKLRNCVAKIKEKLTKCLGMFKPF